MGREEQGAEHRHDVSRCMRVYLCGRGKGVLLGTHMHPPYINHQHTQHPTPSPQHETQSKPTNTFFHLTYLSRASSGKNRQMSLTTAPGFTATARTRAPPAYIYHAMACGAGSDTSKETTNRNRNENNIIKMQSTPTLAWRLISWASSSCASCVVVCVYTWQRKLTMGTTAVQKRSHTTWPDFNIHTNQPHTLESG